MTRQHRPPPPLSVSESARGFWERQADPDEPEVPAGDDREGWRTLAAVFDTETAEELAGAEADLDIDQVELDGVATYVLRAKDADPATGPAFLNIHGGAFFLNGGDLARSTACAIASINGMTTWSPDYRMLPRYPYPAGLDDCLNVYRHLLRMHPASHVFVGGISAGGNLAAALVLRARDEGLPAPAALVLLSPELDLTESGDSFDTLDGVDVLVRLRRVNEVYAGGHDLTHPYLSPLFADADGFPPTFLQAGTRDLFLSNAARMHARLCAAGVDAELHISEAMPHGGFGGSTPEDRHVYRMVRRFLDRHRNEAAESN